MPSESVHARSYTHLPAHTPVAGALRAVESFLLRGGQRTARRNAWASVVADRQRAQDRREAESEMAALITGAATTLVTRGAAVPLTGAAAGALGDAVLD